MRAAQGLPASCTWPAAPPHQARAGWGALCTAPGTAALPACRRLNCCSGASAVFHAGSRAIGATRATRAIGATYAIGATPRPVLHRVGRQRPPVLIDVDLPADERKGPLRAGLAFTALAAHADRRGHLRVLQVQALGVDQARRMLDIATQADGKGLARLAVAFLRARHAARHPQV